MSPPGASVVVSLAALLTSVRTTSCRVVQADAQGTATSARASEAARLLATVVGQDLEEGADGVFRIARRVSKDRVISTVDPQARHGHKTAARGFDGYKAHVAVDPDSEFITATTVSPGNAGDASVAKDLIADLLGEDEPAATSEAATDEPTEAATGEAATGEEPTQEPTGEAGTSEAGTEAAGGQPGAEAEDEPVTVYGDNAYGTGGFQDRLHDAGIDSRCKTQRPTAPGGLFAKDRFEVDLSQDTVTCPAGATARIRRGADGTGTASFGAGCARCPLRERCTTAAGGRTISVGPHEDALARARTRQGDPDWQADYRATRPKVERKLAHLMRRKHGGRRARVRGQAQVDADFRLLATATNIARLAVLGLRSTSTGWVTAAP